MLVIAFVLVCLVSHIDSYIMAYTHDTREQLLEANQCGIASNVRLAPSIWTTMKLAGICAKRPTQRSRAGRNRHMHVVITQTRSVI